MKSIKKGDIVGRISYGKDIIFVVERIIYTQNNKKVALLKGVTVRIQADSPIDDLELIEEKKVKEHLRALEECVEERVKKNNIILSKNKETSRERVIIHTGRILHIDGDRRYAEKSNMYYKKIGLNAVVKNIPEKKQPFVICNLVQRYNPEIIVITGHDGMIKKGTGFNDLSNYRNSAYFIKSVEQIRKANIKKDLVIFAGACQSYYEGIMIAGANFASSPARILIDFMDPLIVAEKIATTSENQFVKIKDFETELRDGERGISGIGGRGKKKIITM